MRHLNLTKASDYPQGTFLELPFPADSSVPARVFAQRRHTGIFEFSLLFQREAPPPQEVNIDFFDYLLSLRADEIDLFRGDLWIESRTRNNPISWVYYRVLTNALPSVLYARVGGTVEVKVPADTIENLPQEVLKSGVSVSQFQGVFTRVSMMKAEPNPPRHMWFRLHPQDRETCADYRNGPDETFMDGFLFGSPQPDLEIEFLKSAVGSGGSHYLTVLSSAGLELYLRQPS